MIVDETLSPNASQYILMMHENVLCVVVLEKVVFFFLKFLSTYNGKQLTPVMTPTFHMKLKVCINSASEMNKKMNHFSK